MSTEVPYPRFEDARRDYPYTASLVAATDRRRPPAAWAFARLLDSGEVEVLYDGAGTVERWPASCVRLSAPPDAHLQEDPDSAAAWDRALNQHGSN